MSTFTRRKLNTPSGKIKRECDKRAEFRGLAPGKTPLYDRCLSRNRHAHIAGLASSATTK